MIVDAKLSFSLVENEAFCACCRSMNNHVPPISRRTLVRVIEDEHANIVPVIKETIRKISSNIAITEDTSL